MLPSRILNTIAAAVLLLVTAGSALAQSPDAEILSRLQERDASIKRHLGPVGSEISAEDRELLREVVNGFLDFGAMAEGALGPHWGDLTEDQQTEFVSVFAGIIRGQSLSNLDPYRASVSYESVQVDGTTAHVVTNTVYDDVPVVVEYNLRQAGDTWMATDIILDQVSTVDGYARSFRSMIRRRGFDTLMERLHKRLDEMNAD